MGVGSIFLEKNRLSAQCGESGGAKCVARIRYLYNQIVIVISAPGVGIDEEWNSRGRRYD